MAMIMVINIIAEIVMVKAVAMKMTTTTMTITTKMTKTITTTAAGENRPCHEDERRKDDKGYCVRMDGRS